MKTANLIVTLLTLAISTLSHAGTNFNDIIVENLNAQNELHQQIKASVSDVKKSVIEGSKTISVASETVNVKSNKDFLRFNKEKKYYKASDSKSETRLAEELQNLE